jgi:hypothetical protein
MWRTSDISLEKYIGVQRLGGTRTGNITLARLNRRWKGNTTDK